MSHKNNNNNNNTRTSTATTTQACAACKYQRRKCLPDCLLAPYFPYDRQRQFQNAHKLFGVSNITKIIKNLNPPQRDQAMATIIFQSDVRSVDPVGGCYRIIRELKHQIEYHKAELDLVLHQLSICREQTAHQHQQAHDHLQTPETTIDSVLTREIINEESLLQYHYELQGGQEQEYVANHHHQLPESVNAWAMQDYSTLLNVQPSFTSQLCDDVKPVLETNLNERHQINYESEELVEQRFAPSTPLLISS